MILAPEQLQLAHDFALSVGITVLVYAFIARPLVRGIKHILRRSPQRKDTSNDQPVRRGQARRAGDFLTDDPVAQAFRDGFKAAQLVNQMDWQFPRTGTDFARLMGVIEGERHLHVVPTDERTAELLHFPTNEKTAS